MKTLSILSFCLGTVLLICQTTDAQDEEKPTVALKAERLNSDSTIKLGGELLNALTNAEKPLENLAVSSAGIGWLLEAIYAGSAEKTALELETSLHLATPDEGQPQLQQELLDRAKAADLQLSISSSAWFSDRYPVKDLYQTFLQENYNAVATELDYSKPGQAAKTINQWVNNHTLKMIEEIVRPSDFSADTLLTLVNAVAFKGVWEHPFDPKKTKPAPFQLLDGSKYQTPLMHTTQTLRSGALGESAQWLALPFRGENHALIVCLPNEPGVEALEATETALAGFDAQKLSKLLREASADLTNLTLPRFELNVGADLIPALKKLGVSQLFKQAQLPAITDAEVSVTSLRHQVRIEVNEKGAKAAAATAAVITTKSIRQPSPPKDFIVDRPFGFLIVDEESGTALFTGRVVKPTTSR